MSATANKKTEQKSPPLLELRGISFAAADKPIVTDVDLTLEQGEIGAIIGPSGSGKSTLMRLIAGFELPHGGSIMMDGQILSTTEHSVEPENRGVGMVFQDIVMFPHLTVAQNIAFGISRWQPDKQQERIRELLSLFGLPGFEDRYPHSLSGGEQQRIALARSMARRPNLLLLDEAFSSLDFVHRQKLVPQVREILKNENISAILVTHDHNEAFVLADQVGIMQNGRLEQWDTPFNLYHKPGNRFAARFVGEGVLIAAKVIDKQKVQTAIGIHSLDNSENLQIGDKVEMLLRPDDILHDDESDFKGKVLQKSFRGSHFLYQVQLESNEQIFCLADSHHDHRIGEWIGLNSNIEHVVIFNDIDK